MHGDRSKSNALMPRFITLVHNIRGGCWKYGTRPWTFPPIFCYILLLCDRRQQRSSLTVWHLTWMCIWSKGVELNSSTQKKWHPLSFIDPCWIFMETKQCHFSNGNSNVKDKLRSREPCRYLLAQHAGSYSLLAKILSKMMTILKNSVL